MMSKIRFLTWAVVVLTLLNLFSLALLWRPPGPPPHPENARHLIIKRLRFDETQKAAYAQLVEKHQADIRQKDRETAAVRQALYAGLRGEAPANSDSLLAEIGRLCGTVEHIHLAHFQEIKNLCRPDQVPAFNDLAKDLEGLFHPPKPPAKQ